jgi:hypothetical protein
MNSLSLDSDRPTLQTSWPFAAAMGLILLWVVFDVVRSYPASFYPRIWDEAIYARDALVPGSLLTEPTGAEHYGSMKLGYGLSLLGAVAVFGASGLSYLSTLCWLLAIGAIGAVLVRRFGWITGAFGTAFLSYSPFWGKYIAEASPTALEGLCFVLLWLAYLKRRWWLTGFCVGLIAFVDFKWAVPAGLAVVAAELIVERRRALWERVQFVVWTGIVAVGCLALAALLHPPYAEHLRGYLVQHRYLVHFEPSAVFAYYLILFGAAPALLVALAAWVVRPIRQNLKALRPESKRALYLALTLAAVPILYNSLVNPVLGMRFFAVQFPLLAVAIAVSACGVWRWLWSRTVSLTPTLMNASRAGTIAIAAAVIVVGSDGPARHLRLPFGVPDALRKLATTTDRDGTISSYMWPVVHFGWGYPIAIPPNTVWGIVSTDKWLMLDPMVDRLCVEYLRPPGSKDADSLWAIRETLAAASDSLFSVPSDFYASDYFICDYVSYGIPMLRRWRALRPKNGNYLTVYRLNMDRLRRQTESQ